MRGEQVIFWGWLGVIVLGLGLMFAVPALGR